RRVCHHDMVAQCAVMADVNICHEKVMVPDSRMPAATLRTSMDVDVFAEHVVIADCEKRLFTFELQILWLKADRCKWVKLVVLPDCGWPFDNHVGFKAATLSDLHTGTDAAIWANRYAVTNLSLGAHNGRRVNHGC